jgi:hypothetical protein
MKKKPNPILHSFPVQLLFTHARRNAALLLVWFVLIAAMSGGTGKVYGIHYLFLDPEYLGSVNFWSFFIVGITFGQLTMAFHVASYILDSHRYTFLGLINRPFAKFALNNSVIPLVTFVWYLILIIKFQTNYEIKNWQDIVLDAVGFVSGVISLLFISFYYFKLTNTDILRMMTKKVDRRLKRAGISRERVLRKWNESKRQKSRFIVHNYFDLDFSLKKTDRLAQVYDNKSVLKVFDQNHMNSVLIGLSLILILVIMGGFIENPILQIPAGASSMLIMTVAIVLLGAVSYWFRGWGFAFMALMLFVANAGVKSGWIKGTHEAKGLNYTTELAEYSMANMRKLNDREAYQQDVENVIASLEKWKLRQADAKPKMIITCVSGGGQRAALWTMNVMMNANEVLEGDLMKKTALITGASGGMIGAAYYRELYLRSLTEPIDLEDEEYLQKIAKDNLNPVVFSLLVNDAFMSFRDYEYAGKRYTKDRGYAFERNLNNNINNVLDKRVSEYEQPESEGLIPTLLLSPTVANDGRKLYITSRPFSFMNIEEHSTEYSKIRGVDYLRLFEKQDASQLSFMSALRMSASFPYITPTISLPSRPRMEIMDAGIADNFGVSDALRFMYVFRDWINTNTSGVVMVIIRDTEPNEEVHARSIPSLVDRLTYPIASVYNNLGNIQDRNNDVRIEQAKEWFDGRFQTVEFIYDNRRDGTEQERASLSWHLTTKEKQSVIHNIRTVPNKKALRDLRALAHSE